MATVVGDGGVPEGVLLVLRQRLLVAVRHGAGALLELGLQRDDVCYCLVNNPKKRCNWTRVLLVGYKAV